MIRISVVYAVSLYVVILYDVGPPLDAWFAQAVALEVVKKYVKL